MSQISSGLDQQAISFIRENKVAQKILQHLHPNADTAIVVEDEDSKCPLVGIIYGASRRWLNATRESREPFDVVARLHNLGVLEENFFDGNNYFALQGEWSHSHESTIYTQLCPKPKLRRQWHSKSGLKVDPVYYLEK